MAQAVKTKKSKKRLPQPGEDAYYKLREPKGCGYEKKFRYNLSLGTNGDGGSKIITVGMTVGTTKKMRLL